MNPSIFSFWSNLRGEKGHILGGQGLIQKDKVDIDVDKGAQISIVAK